MEIKIHTKIVMLLFSIVFITSCTSNKNLVYMQESAVPQNASAVFSYEPMIQSDDVLMIVVSAENPEVANPYNMKSVVFQGNGEMGPGLERQQTYLVNKEGVINFPMLGLVKLGGLTRTQSIEKIKKLLENHIKEPTVNIRILNFKVSVLGEVAKPGVFTVSGERITLMEALCHAGDLTIYGKRNSVMIIREKEGVKSIEKVDITKRDFVDSPYYYLSQNDVVYVEPNKTKVNSSVIGPNITVGISALSLIITIIALTIR